MKERNSHISKSRSRRIRQLRHRMILAFVTLCISLMLGIFGCGFLSRAQSDSAEVSCKYFTSVMVQPGDTLYSIAQKYADEHYSSVDAYVAEVCLTNHMMDTDIHIGDYLIIPYYSTEFR